ncbi:MAG: trypsin-like peptidase domain-containing protein [Deltaproteobacteria bacterium]|nr:trypsin-like peptidase domain-containing protein [Deltaproteobacteria bacterium]MBW1978122.1 trypsin-like peptidase domain-containing protein [Deltaproteobacteria bacterium]MBW2044812.1 trypsin-like peptidase domain-containing protein [Deltaproteobacteria bacterium]MBW2301633.1 trypsin-like peptidase domain-containing protein [Deltaproteobacteria bacterium]
MNGMHLWRKYLSNKLVVLLCLFLALHLGIAHASLRRSPVVIAVEKSRPAVVNISTTVRERISPFLPFSGDDFFKDFFPDLFSREYTRSSLGSGVIIDGTKGYILTNQHVIARASEIKVITSEKQEYQAKLIGADPRSDLAVLQISARNKLPEIKMGNSDDLMIGETVIAIGNPFGLSHTVTTGVVSAVERSVRSEERIYRHLIQTDASINPGNSGGPLLNIDGELIGINTAIYQKAQGIGFAIPINKAKRIVKELLRAGKVRPIWLGIEIQELTDALRSHFGLPSGRGGVLVNDVMSGSTGAKAGLKRGDIIVSVGGIPVKGPGDYRDALAEFTPEDRLEMKVFRGGKFNGVVLQPSTFPPSLALNLVYRRLGIKVGKLSKRTGGGYGSKSKVVVKEVRRGSEAGKIGVKPGDLILKVNNMLVSNLDEFKKAISEYFNLPSINLVIQRGPYAYSLTLPF